MKLRLSFPKRKLRATATRRVAQPRAYEEEEEEPTMKLSSAFVVVLLLHLVAVGGIYAFNSVKAHHPAVLDEPSVEPMKPAQVIPDAQTAPVAHPASITSRETTKTPDVPVAAKSVEPSKSSETHSATALTGPKDSGAFHTVAKGENPVLIARRLGVRYDDLLKLNHIDDPKKLQIGQKLHVPVKARTASN